MKKLLLFILLCGSNATKAQLFTRGEFTQMYWNWRPDIADSCYEFTFEAYYSMLSAYDNYPLYYNVYFWNECNYGKLYIGETDTGYSHIPLHDTLYRTTYIKGIVDTFCGFASPYQKGIPNGGSQTTSPHRKKLVYTGLIYLPEKCQKWSFAIGPYALVSGSDHERVYFYSNGGPQHVKNSNIDSFGRDLEFNTITPTGIGGGIIGCSLNNLDFAGGNSPRSLSAPIYYFPTNKQVEYNPGIYDPDHDKLVITIGDTIKSARTLLSGIPGPALFIKGFFALTDSAGNYQPEVITINSYFATRDSVLGANPLRFNSQNNPFDTDSTFHLVDSTGKTTFTAASNMEPILYYSIKKYRKEILMSETFFVNQFTLINENREPSFMRIDTNTLLNASFNNQGTMMSCTGLPISFDAYVKLPILGGDLIVSTTADTTLPGNGACTITGNHTDSVRLQFSWTPPANARGLYNVYVSAKDSNCVAPYNHYLQVYTWSFFIDSCGSVSVTEVVKDDEMVILYPNPASEKLMITSNAGFSKVKIFNVLSELVYEKKFANAKQRDISISNLPSGIYLVNIDGRFIRKLVVVR